MASTSAMSHLRTRGILSTDTNQTYSAPSHSNGHNHLASLPSGPFREDEPQPTPLDRAAETLRAARVSLEASQIVLAKFRSKGGRRYDPVWLAAEKELMDDVTRDGNHFQHCLQEWFELRSTIKEKR